MSYVLQIEKISITDKISDSRTDSGDSLIGYNLQLEHSVFSGRDAFGNPALDLSKDKRLHSVMVLVTDPIVSENLKQDIEDSGITQWLIETSTKSARQEQKLQFQTFLFGKINPDIEIDEKSGDKYYKYPFSYRAEITPEEDNIAYLEVFLFQKRNGKYNQQYQSHIVIEDGNLNIEDTSQRIEDARTVFYDNLFNFSLFTPSEGQKGPAMSDLFSSYGQSGEIKGMFFFDKRKYLIQNSKFGKMLQNTDIPPIEEEKIYNNSKIVNLRIKRRKLANFLDFKNRPVSAEKNQSILQIISTTESDSTGTLIDTSKSNSQGTLLANIKEIENIDLPSIKSEKIVGFDDFSTADDGEYQYSAEIRVQDGILIWLIDTLNQLIEIQVDIDKIITKKPTTSSGGAALAPSTVISERISTKLLSLNDEITLTSEDLKKYIKNLLFHEVSAIQLKRNNDSLIQKILSLIGKSGVVSQTNSSQSKTYTKNNSDLFFLSSAKKFPNTVNFADARDFSYDYLGSEPVPSTGRSRTDTVSLENISNRDFGVAKITATYIKERFDDEFLKIMKEIPDNFENLNNEILLTAYGYSSPSPTILQSSYFNFENNYYSFLSPRVIGDTLLGSSNQFDIKIFNKEHYKKKFSKNLTADTSISYYLMNLGVSVEQGFFDQTDAGIPTSTKKTTTAREKFGPGDPINFEYEKEDEPYVSGLSEPPLQDNYKTMINMMLKSEEGWDLSKEDFDLANITSNLLSKIPEEESFGKRPSNILLKVSNMPNQVRALFAGKSDKCINQWLSPALAGDYFKNPNTYYMMKQNYMNLVKVEVLTGFENDITGIPDINFPIFRKLTSGDLNSASDVICRVTPYVDAELKVGLALDKITYSNKYFILQKTN